MNLNQKIDPIIIDTEVRVVHPEARCPDFGSRFPNTLGRDIYQSPDIQSAVSLWAVEATIDSMDSCGIAHAVISGLAWPDSAVQKDNNDYVKHCLESNRGRFKGLFTADPSQPNRTAEEILELDRDLYVGVELIPKWQGVRIDDPALDPIFEAVQEAGLMIKAYTAHPTQTLDGDAPFRTLQFLRKYPEITTLIPHLGGLLCLYGLFPPIAQHLKNAYFITSVSATMKMVSFAAEVNASQLLFGTDFPFNHSFDQKTSLEAYSQLSIQEPDKSRILGETAKQLFGFGS